MSLPHALTPLPLPASQCIGEEIEAQKALVSYSKPHGDKRQSQNAVQAWLTPESKLLTTLLANNVSLLPSITHVKVL